MTTVNAEAGESIYDAARRAISQTHWHNMPYVQLVFNDIKITVSSKSDAADIVQIYGLMCRLKQYERN